MLAIRRHDDDLPGKLGSVVLRPGDVLLVLASPEFERQWRGPRRLQRDRVSTAPPPIRRRSAGLVIAAIVAMVALTVTNVLDLMEASLVAAVALIACASSARTRPGTR